MKRMILFVVLAVALAGCGSGGGNSASAPAVTSVKTNPVGKYSLVQIAQEQSRTAVPFAAYSTFYGHPGNGWTGTLKLGNTSWDETMIFNGDPTNINGTYAFVIDVPYQTGSFSMHVLGGATLAGRYTIVDDYTLRVTYNPQPGSGNYTRWTEHWNKNSDTLN